MLAESVILREIGKTLPYRRYSDNMESSPEDLRDFFVVKCTSQQYLVMSRHSAYLGQI